MKRTIPFFSLKRQWSLLKKSLLPLIETILDEQHFIGGPRVESFEQKLSNYLEGTNVISCNSGTDALWLALQALNVEKNDIVLTTPFSFIASSSEIVAHGAHPVFIDIEADTYQISPSLLEAWLIKNTIMKEGKTIHTETGYQVTGIIAVNIFGQCADYSTLRRIATEWNLWIVEDGAQSLGARASNKKATTFGDISTLSFYPTKNVGAYGDAGAACTPHPELAHRLRALRNHGRHDKYNYKEYGINSRLDTLQAAVLEKKLELCDELNEKRRALAAHYSRRLKNLEPHIILPIEEPNNHHIFHQYSIQASNRHALIETLSQAGIGHAIFYPQPLSSFSFLKTHPALYTECPITEHVCSSILSLPIWPELEHDEIDYICDTLETSFPKKSITTSQALAQL